MQCTQAETLIPLYAGDDLSAREAGEVREHLDACAHCRALAAGFTESRAWLREFSAPQFGETVFDDLRNAVLAETNAAQPPRLEFWRPRWNPRFALLAASLLLLIGLGIYAWRQQPKHHIETFAGNGGSAPARREEPPQPAPQQDEPVRYGERQRSAPRQDEPMRYGERQRPAPRQDEPMRYGERQRPAPRQDEPMRYGERQRPAPRQDEPMRYGERQRPAPRQVARSSKRKPREIPAPQPKQSDAIANNTQPPPNVDVATNNATAKQEMLRIEMQTADPNIRIIWFAPKTDASNPTNAK